MEKPGASVVISHHILEGHQQEYEKWLEEIVPMSSSSQGFLDLQIVRPIIGLTYVYTVIIRFDTAGNLKNWMDSDQRRQLIARAGPLFRKGDSFQIRSGLDFLFGSGESGKAPVRWKQFLVTWSAIYPLSLLVPLLVLTVLNWLGLPADRYLGALISSACIVLLMVYVVMPSYTRLIKKWLSR